MGLETATFIHELDSSNPVGGSDHKSQGDDHLRLVKSTLQSTFPNVEGAVTSSHAELNKLTGVTATATELNKLAGLTATTTQLNFVTGVTSAIQTQLDGKLATNGNGSAVTNLNASSLATGTVAVARLPFVNDAAEYSPAFTVGGNVTLSAVQEHFYQRVGDIVSFSGSVLVNIVSATPQLSSFGIALPIASNLANSGDVAGSGNINTFVAATTVVATLSADTANDRIGVSMNTSSAGTYKVSYSGHYRVK